MTARSAAPHGSSRATELYSKVLAGAPDSISNLDHLGFSELQVDKPQLAIIDFKRAANLGDAYAMDMLGKMYLLGTSVPQDRVRAIQWLERAAAPGYQPSKEILPMARNSAMQPRLEPGGPRLSAKSGTSDPSRYLRHHTPTWPCESEGQRVISDL